MHHARTAIVLASATLGVASAAFASGPTVGPFNPPKRQGVAPAMTFTQPPPNSPAWLKNYSFNSAKAPAGVTLTKVEHGICYVGHECILHGMNLGNHDTFGHAPPGYTLMVTDIVGGKGIRVPAVAVAVTAWTQNLLAFTTFRSRFTRPGTYDVVIVTSSGAKAVATSVNATSS